MKPMLAAAGLAVLLSVIGQAAAQSGVDLRTTSPPDRSEPRPTATTRPGEIPYDPRVQHRPVFIGPTITSEAGEFGLSAWIAPDPPVDGPRSAGDQTNGWASLGLTFTWGGPPQRPSAARHVH